MMSNFVGNLEEITEKMNNCNMLREAPSLDAVDTLMVSLEAKDGFDEQSVTAVVRDGGLQSTLAWYCSPNCSIDHVTKQQNIKYLSTLPDLLSNKSCGGGISVSSILEMYSEVIILVMTDLHGAMQQEISVTLSPLAYLLGCVCARYDGQLLLRGLVCRWEELMLQGYLWRRMCCDLLARVQDHHLEKLVTSLVQLTCSPCALHYMLGGAAIGRRKVKQVLCEKLVLMQWYDTHTLRNIVGYLTLVDVMSDVVMLVCDVWGSSSCLQHMCEEQHVYMSKAILLTAAYSKHGGGKIRDAVISGVTAHLNANNPVFRDRGILLAKLITDHFPMGEDIKLDFTIPETDEAKELVNIFQSALKGTGLYSYTPPVVQCEESPPAVAKEAVTVTSSKVDRELDSDDDEDFVGYDMSCDTAVSERKIPRYIRDVIPALMSDDYDTWRNALTHTTQLIHTQPPQPGLAVELLRLFIHLENKYNVDEFEGVCHEVEVTLVKASPQACAEYLASQFMDANYSIGQRLNILKVISSAAYLIAFPKFTEADSSAVMPKDQSEWQTVVQKRIDAKTKRYFSSPANVLEKKNAFSSVCGYFFFPLASAAGSNVLSDSLVLCEWVRTLGCVTTCSMHAPTCSKLCAVLLQVCAAVRGHSDSTVRAAVLWAVLGVCSVSALCELEEWLEWCRCCLEDPAQEVRHAARCTATHILKTTRNVLNVDK